MQHPLKSSIAAVESVIRATGSRVTPARVRVLSLIKSAHGSLSRSEIERLLCSDGLPDIDGVTVYRVLDWLVNMGLVHKAANAHGVLCFTAAEPDVEHSQHAHFRCTGCGGVSCLDIPAPTAPQLPEGFRLLGVEMDIRGECPACVNKPLHCDQHLHGMVGTA